MASYTFDPSVRRYRSAAGKLVPTSVIDRTRDQLLNAAGEHARGLVEQMSRGDISRSVFASEMRKLVKQEYGAAYILGRGGRDQMTPSDWAKIGAEVRRQQTFINNFAVQLADGTATEGQALVRATMYADGAVTAFERGQAAAFDVELPGYPGDGGTQCLTKCRCRWSITGSGADLEATWTLESGANHCAGCLDRADEWSPWTADAEDAE